MMWFDEWQLAIEESFRQQKQSIENKTIQQMTRFVFEHASDYYFLQENQHKEAAFVVSRTFFERLVSLLFILKDVDEVNVRAKLFYYSSRIRELLRVQSLLGEFYQPHLVKELDECYQKQEALCQKEANCSLVEWIDQKINWYKKRFDKMALHYVSQKQLDRDHRRKGWCYIDVKINPVIGQSIGNFADLTQYTLGEEGAFLYHYFYGLNSLYTHGYDTDERWMMGFAPQLTLTNRLVAHLLLSLIAALFQWLDQPVPCKVQQQQKQCQQELLKKSVVSDEKLLPPLMTEQEVLTVLEKRFDSLVAAYRLLKENQRFLAARLLVRTLFGLTENRCFLCKDPAFSKPRIFRYQLSSRIQFMSNLKLLLKSPILYGYYQIQSMEQVDEQLTEWLLSAKEQYDAITQFLVPNKVLRRDKRRRNWFVEISENHHLKNSQQLASYALVQHPLFCWRFEDGFHSVHVHGINLDNRYRLHGHNLIFTNDLADLRLCDVLVKSNIEDVNRICKSPV